MRLLSAGTRPGNDLNKCLERYLCIKPAADLTFDEWRQFPPRLGDAALALGFAIGDWLIFGERFAAQRSLSGFEDMPAKVPHERYEQALLDTRLDIVTLQNFAYVARHVPRSVRHELLSFEHHRAVARLDEADQRQWIVTTLAENEAGRRMSVRRWRRSIEASAWRRGTCAGRRSLRLRSGGADRRR